MKGEFGTGLSGNGQPDPARTGTARTLPAPFEPTSRGLLPACGLRFLFATSRSKPVGQRLAEGLEQDADPFPLLVRSVRRTAAPATSTSKRSAWSACSPPT